MVASQKLRYKDLRQGLIDSYIARGNKSLTARANGDETITGLTQLDYFFGFPENPGPRVINIPSDTAKGFAKKRKALEMRL